MVTGCVNGINMFSDTNYRPTPSGTYICIKAKAYSTTERATIVSKHVILIFKKRLIGVLKGNMTSLINLSLRTSTKSQRSVPQVKFKV